MRHLFPILLLLACPAALAHVGLAVTVPDHDAVLEQAPTVLHFQFMNTMTVTNVRLEITAGERLGERIDVRLPRNSIGQSTAFGDIVDLELPPLAPATYPTTYKVLWQAVSLDGHILLDDFSFTVTGP
jgi:methionine-rich copper-binding protein CopC